MSLSVIHTATSLLPCKNFYSTSIVCCKRSTAWGAEEARVSASTVPVPVSVSEEELKSSVAVILNEGRRGDGEEAA